MPELIEQAQRLTSAEQLSLAIYLQEMSQQHDSADVNRRQWAEIQAKRNEILKTASKIQNIM